MDIKWEENVQGEPPKHQTGNPLHAPRLVYIIHVTGNITINKI